MRPEAKDGVPLDAANFQFVFAVLKHNRSTIGPNWEEVARECGISYARNAPGTNFKSMINKLGFQLVSGNISLIDGSTPALVATPENATPTGRESKTPATKKKRKIAVVDEEEVENQQDGDKVKMDAKVDISEVSEQTERTMVKSLLKILK